MDILKNQANKTLLEIKAVTKALQQIQGEYQAKVDKIKADYQAMAAEGKRQLKVLDKQIKSLMKQYKTQLFKGRDDVVNLPAGAMIFTIEKRVVRIKKMLARLEEMNRDDLLKFHRSVDWDKIEGLDDTDLAKIGTQRREFEKFSYNVAGNTK